MAASLKDDRKSDSPPEDVAPAAVNNASDDDDDDDDDDSLSEDSFDENVMPQVKRDPFFAFIPQLAGWSAKIVCGEVLHCKTAVVGFPAWSKQYAKDTYTFYRSNPRILYDEVISGFTVAIMQVPESIAFSFVAGVPPLSGLHATFWMATITGIFGGKPGMISGAAGALAVVVADLTVDDGVLDYLDTATRLNVLYMTMIICGLMQIGFAIFRLAKLVRLIPETGMIGFMNGLAIIIFMAQLPAFQKCTTEPLFVMCTIDERQWLTFSDDTWVLILSLVHVAMCMLIMKFSPKVPYIGKIVPASLVALLVGTLVEHTLFRKALGVATRTVEETAPMSGDPPKFDWPRVPTDSTTVGIMFSFGITLAAIGSVESVLTLQACNEITDTVPKESDANQENFAQGLANFVSGMFRAMGGDAMIGQSTINIMNGARHRVSSTTSGLFMLLFTVALSGFIELLPVSTLTGVLFMVVLSTFQWKTFQILRYGRLSDSAVILTVTLLAVFFNLAVAIAAGIVLSALVHAWDTGNLISANIELKRMIINGRPVDLVKYVRVKGSIFFGSSRHFINMFHVADDPSTVVIDFKDALVVDHTAVAAIQGIVHRFHKVGKTVLLVNLPDKSHGRMQRTGDHEMMKSQITHASNIQDLVEQPPSKQQQKDTTAMMSGGGADEENQEETHVEEMSDDSASSSSDAEEEPRYTNVQELPMFQNPVDPVEDELSRLTKGQGRVSIHEPKKER